MLDESLKPVAAGIKLVIFDVDGVLTDGGLIYGAEGESYKVFNAKDGVGLKLLRANGIEVAVISGRRSPPLECRMRDLGVEHFYPGCDDKVAAYEKIKAALQLDDAQVAYVGDDVVDLPVMEIVGFAITPRDGYPLMQLHSDWVTEAAGGRGVAREVADALLLAREDFDLMDAYRVLVSGKKGRVIQ